MHLLTGPIRLASGAWDDANRNWIVQADRFSANL
jgi:hypothetical protein